MVGVGEFTTVASSVGFPAVAFFLMYRLTADTIRQNTAAIEGLRDEITKHENEHNNRR